MRIRYTFILITAIILQTIGASDNGNGHQSQPQTIPLRKTAEKKRSSRGSTSPMQLSVSPFDQNTTLLSAAYKFAQLAFQEDNPRQESTY